MAVGMAVCMRMPVAMAVSFAMRMLVRAVAVAMLVAFFAVMVAMPRAVFVCVFALMRRVACFAVAMRAHAMPVVFLALVRVAMAVPKFSAMLTAFAVRMGVAMRVLCGESQFGVLALCLHGLAPLGMGVPAILAVHVRMRVFLAAGTAFSRVRVMAVRMLFRMCGVAICAVHMLSIAPMAATAFVGMPMLFAVFVMMAVSFAVRMLVRAMAVAMLVAFFAVMMPATALAMSMLVALFALMVMAMPAAVPLVRMLVPMAMAAFYVVVAMRMKMPVSFPVRRAASLRVAVLMCMPMGHIQALLFLAADAHIHMRPPNAAFLRRDRRNFQPRNAQRVHIPQKFLPGLWLQQLVKRGHEHIPRRAHIAL